MPSPIQGTLICGYVTAMRAEAQQVALFIVSEIRTGARNEAGRGLGRNREK